MTTFTHHGFTVHLTLEELGAGNIWCAAVEGRELLHLLPWREGEDVDAVVHRVKDWIDDGMPADQNTWYPGVQLQLPMQTGGRIIEGEPGEYPRISE